MELTVRNVNTQFIKPPQIVIEKLNQLSMQQQISYNQQQKLIDKQTQQYQENQQLQDQQQDCLYINPTNFYSLLWNGIIITSIYIYLIEIGFIIGFGSTIWVDIQQSYRCLIVYSIIIILFLIDIIICFFKGYYKIGTGKIIKNRRLILKKYVKSYFFFDVITTIFILIPLVGQYYYLDILQFFFFLKLGKKYQYQMYIHRQVQHNRFLRNAIAIAILSADTAIIAHFVACLFVGIDIYTNNAQLYGNSTQYYWLSNNADYTNNLIGSQWYFQYIYAQQYSSGTLSTLAPGPFPKNPIQVFYVILAMSSFIILTSYIADVIITLFYSQQQRRVFHETNIQVFQNYMSIKSVGGAVKQRVQNFFELVWQIQGKSDLQFQNKVILRLSDKLRQQLLIQLVNVRPLSFIKYLDPTFQMKNKVVMIAQQVLTDANQVLFQSGKNIITQKYIYIPIQGLVKFYMKYAQNYNQYKQNILSLSNMQKILGVYQFITNQDYFYCAKTIHISQFYRFSQTKFLQIINVLSMQQKYKQVQHRLLLNRQLSIVNKRCLVCSEQHLQYQCNEINATENIRNNLRQIMIKNKRKKDFQRFKGKMNKICYDRKLLQIKRIQSNIQNNDILNKVMNMNQMMNKVVSQVIYEQIEIAQNYNSYFIENNIKKIGKKLFKS